MLPNRGYYCLLMLALLRPKRRRLPTGGGSAGRDGRNAALPRLPDRELARSWGPIMSKRSEEATEIVNVLLRRAFDHEDCSALWKSPRSLCA